MVARLAAEVLADSFKDPMVGAALGWFGIAVPEEFGGAGGSQAELAPIVEQCGANCAAAEVVWTAGIALPLLLAAVNPPAELIARLAGGTSTVAVPIADPADLAAAGDGPIRFLALGSASADHLLVPVCRAGVTGVAILAPGHPARRSAAEVPVDRSRALSSHEVDLTAVEPEDVVEVLDLVGVWRGHQSIALGLDAVGAAGAALSATVEYSRARHQFGRPIGSFQAYKHRCTDALLRHKLAQVVSYEAAAAPGDIRLWSAAAVEAGLGAVFVCGEAVQLHGGVGFTWEAGIGGYQKRTRADALGLAFATDPALYRADLAGTGPGPAGATPVHRSPMPGEAIGA